MVGIEESYLSGSLRIYELPKSKRDVEQAGPPKSEIGPFYTFARSPSAVVWRAKCLC
jgi:hypothetical protein